MGYDPAWDMDMESTEYCPHCDAMREGMLLWNRMDRSGIATFDCFTCNQQSEVDMTDVY
jgi:hypothetical protein